MTSARMVSTTAQHPEGYTRDEGNQNVWWGTSTEGEGYNLQPAWTADQGHRLLIDVVELTPEEAASMAADLARWGSQNGQ